jgi:hypothetical protein
MAARLDLAQYQNSCRTILNGIVIPQGGVEKRPGAYYVGEVKDSTQPTYLLTFKYSADQQYILELGNLYIRFWYNGAQVVSSPGVPLEVVTPYLTAEIPSINTLQSADVLYIVHPNHPPAKLSRTATGWAYGVITFQEGEVPVSDVTAGSTGNVRLRVINHGFTSNNFVYVSGVVGVPQANGIFQINVIDVDSFDLIGNILPGNQITNAVTYGGQIKITAPGFPTTTGEVVNIGGIQGTIEANGAWGITIVDSSNFVLNGSSFVNAYISGGWVSSTSAYSYVSGGGVTLIQPISGAAANSKGEIRITSVDHGFTTGQGVYVTGVTGTTEANGTWEITKIDDNTYDLNGSVFAHTYVSGGFGVAKTFATANNYPSVIAFFEQRLVFGGTTNEPQTLWLSVTGDFENLTRGTNDDDGLKYTLNSDGVDAIRWLTTWNVLLVGTVDGEWRFGGASITDPLTPSSALAKIQSNKGSANIKALLIGDLVVFVQYYGKKIYQIGYNFVSDSFTSAELTKLSSHITTPNVIWVENQEAPEIIVWMGRSDGDLASMTFYTDEKIIAFSKHTTDGLFESGAHVHGPTEDQVWVIVNRTINGVTKRYIEYFMPRDFSTGQSALRPLPYFFVDSGLAFDGGDPVTIINATKTNPVVISYAGNNPTNGWTVMLDSLQGMTDVNENVYTVANVDSSAKTFELALTDGTNFNAYISGGTWIRVINSVTGIGHLEGKTCDIYADGYALAPQVVASGSLPLGGYYNRVSAGLHYDFIIEPQSIEINAQTGTSAGMTKRIEKLMLRVYNTVGLKAGPSLDSLEELIFGVQSGLFTGDVPLEFSGDYDTNAYISIKHDQPLPCTILGIITFMSAYER